MTAWSLAVETAQHPLHTPQAMDGAGRRSRLANP